MGKFDFLYFLVFHSYRISFTPLFSINTAINTNLAGFKLKAISMGRLLAVLLLILPISGAAQNHQERWVGHFSYVSIKDISQGNNKIYVAAENAVFIYDISSLNI